MARVNFESIAFRDVRIKHLGILLKQHKYFAMGALITLWEHCTEAQRYCLTAEEIDMVVEIPKFSESLLQSKLGSKRKANLIYVKGTRKRIEWLKVKRDNGKRGGRPKGAKTKKDPGNLNVTETEPKRNPPTPTPTPTLKRTYTPSPEVMALYLDWVKFAEQHSKTIRPDVEKWCKAIDSIVKRKICSLAQLKTLLRFVEEDDFWLENALSLPGLLRRRAAGEPMKIEKILAQMEKAGVRSISPLKRTLN